MVKVSIACLIYKSTRWLDFVYDQVKKHTNLEDNEFYFVANDACEEVLTHLKTHDIPHYIHNNTVEQRKEWYINNVYRAWNTAGKMAKGEYIVFINSDMAFSPRWLETLQESITDDICVCSRLVERGIMRSGLYGVECNFGNVPHDYNEAGFLQCCEDIKEPEIYPSGLFMPLLIKKEYMEKINYYPEGNIVPGSDIFNPVYAKIGEPCISGDNVLMSKLKTIGVEHFTNFSSIVYHFQEGEMRDTVPEKKSKYSIVIITHDLEAGKETQNSLLPYKSTFFIGTNYISFSKLVNDAILSAENEIVIICSYKTRPKPQDIDRMLEYINNDYGLVALYRFAFFGFRKELIRRIGFMDERYIGGEYEDSDFVRRLIENNISYIEEESIEYIQKPSLWNNVQSKSFFERKWKQDGMNLYKLLPEEKYNYNIGNSDQTVCFKDKTYSRSIYDSTQDFITNVNIIIANK